MHYDLKKYFPDKKFEMIIEQAIPQKEGIFFDGQIFDAYEKAISFIKEIGSFPGGNLGITYIMQFNHITFFALFG